MTQPSLPGNPHFEAGNSEHCTEDAYRIAQATMALAYEQRTANLIALAVAQGGTGNTRAIMELAAAIDARLGGRPAPAAPAPKP